MKLEQRIELLHRSSERLMSGVRDLRRDDAWWVFMRREFWLHLKLIITAWWKFLWLQDWE